MWKRARRLIALAVLALSAAGASAGQLVAPAHATISLVAEGDGFTAGKIGWIGLLFELEQGWHIYWVNPGDAGDPPRVQWDLPAGFRAGEIRWPVPIRLVTGPVIDYGYEGRVLLAVPLQAPADFKAGAPATITADIRYVICRDICIPVKARATLSVPERGATGDAARRALFSATRARWPKPVPAGWDIKAVTDGKHIILGVQTGGKESTAAFFPLNADQIDNAAPQAVVTTVRGLQLTLQRSDPDSKPPSVLNGVVVLGQNRAFEVAVPVTAQH